MEFGLKFFPDVGPEEKTAASYWDEALYLTGLCDELGFTHVRTVEHYFHRCGGYSTNPVVFLAAASQRTREARLITGAVRRRAGAGAAAAGGGGGVGRGPVPQLP